MCFCFFVLLGMQRMQLQILFIFIRYTSRVTHAVQGIYVHSYMSSIQYTNLLLYVLFICSSLRISHTMQNFACNPQKKKKMCAWNFRAIFILHSFNNVNFTSGDARVTRTQTHTRDTQILFLITQFHFHFARFVANMFYFWKPNKSIEYIWCICIVL